LKKTRLGDVEILLSEEHENLLPQIKIYLEYIKTYLETLKKYSKGYEKLVNDRQRLLEKGKLPHFFDPSKVRDENEKKYWLEYLTLHFFELVLTAILSLLRRRIEEFEKEGKISVPCDCLSFTSVCLNAHTLPYKSLLVFKFGNDKDNVVFLVKEKPKIGDFVLFLELPLPPFAYIRFRKEDGQVLLSRVNVGWIIGEFRMNCLACRKVRWFIVYDKKIIYVIPECRVIGIVAFVFNQRNNLVKVVIPTERLKELCNNTLLGLLAKFIEYPELKEPYHL